MTRQEQLAEIYSDMHKSLYGVRARWAWDLSEESLEISIARLDEEIYEEFQREKLQREQLAAKCNVSVEQIIEWEEEQNELWRYGMGRKMKTVDQAFIESLPVEPYEEAHRFELGGAA